MRKQIAVIGATVAMAVAGTALAAGDDPVAGAEDRKAEFAADLAGELAGVNPGQVERALDAVAEDRIAEHQAQTAETLAAELDGVSAEDVAAALDAQRTEMEAAREAGEQPERGDFAESLADKLGVDADELTAALEADRPEGMDGLPGHSGPGGPGHGPGGPIGPHGPIGLSS